MRSLPGLRCCGRSLLGMLLAVGAGTIVTACGDSPSTQAGDSSGQTAQQRAWDAIDAGAAVVDVRTPAEFARGHLPGASNIPHGDITRRLPSVQPDTAASIVLYCRTGSRSGIAARQLRELGYTNVINAGGLVQLQRARPVAPAEE